MFVQTNTTTATLLRVSFDEYVILQSIYVNVTFRCGHSVTQFYRRLCSIDFPLFFSVNHIFSDNEHMFHSGCDNLPVTLLEKDGMVSPQLLLTDATIVNEIFYVCNQH